ncbi:MAG: cobyrinate a,c-diamide synthase [Eggerthellaceae bacterium]|nr:cobyrinate a,c-diamide synthase [Eggerthellaceae bacterium]
MDGIAAPRILIAATSSGSGKTTISCGLMRALANRGLSVQACKCGPDYIDPMFHRRVLGTPSRNLDLFFSDENTVRELVAEGTRTADITLIEGVMGYYDGIQKSSDASAYAVAYATDTPTVLVIGARGRALSAAAEVAGFAQFRNPSHVAGVIVNRVTEGYYPFMKAMIEQETGVPVLGYVPVLEDAGLESRHLGLVTADEVVDLQDKIDRVASVLEQTIDLDALVELARTAPNITFEQRSMPSPCEDAPVVAIARDEAFSFYYDDTLMLMERLGAKLEAFSPIRDAALPDQACGLYLGGGYPELHAEALSGNASMRESICSAIASGMPTIAECGGFMYLHETMEDDQGTPWPMVGAIPGLSYKLGKLGRFGYIDIEARKDNLLCAAGDTLPAHEFHYWDSDNPGTSFHAQKPQSARGWDCAFGTPSMYAGYPHLYLYARPHALKRFLDACSTYRTLRAEAG